VVVHSGREEIIMELPIKPTVWDDALVCPSCGEENLHHEKIEVFERVEDAAEGCHVVVEGRTLHSDPDITGNPSRRRNGLKIRFWCEHCPATPTLELLQHKGSTYMWWGE
jgi:hypothetical protein